MVENFGWLELTLGAVSGAFIMLLMSLLIFVIADRSRKNKAKQKELIGKAVAHMMGKVNELFIAYRLGDLAFEQMERESREYISKITDDINENNSQLSSAYVAVVTRYIEEKTEMLIAIKEDFHHYNSAQQQEKVGHIHVKPTHVPEEAAVDPVLNMVTQQEQVPVSQPIQSQPQNVQPVMPEVQSAPQEIPVMNNEAPIEFNAAPEQTVDPMNTAPVVDNTFAAVDTGMVAQDSEVLVTPQVEAVPSIGGSHIEPQAGTGDDIFDISINEEPSKPTVNETPAAPAFDAISSGMQNESTLGDIDLSSQGDFAPQESQVQDTPFETFTIEEAATPTIETPQVAAESAPIDNALSIQTDEFASAIDNAFDLGGFGGDSTLGNQQQVPSEPIVESNPFQGFEAQQPSGFTAPNPSFNNNDANSKFSLNGSGDLDVEATQEFNLNDIMSQAQDHGMHDQSSKDEGMVSGDDVASKLDSFFS